MLTELKITEFALIQDIKISLPEGLTVISGETGAGKSIFIAALDFVLGSPVNRDMIRQGAEKSTVEAIFVWLPNSKAFKILGSLGVEALSDNRFILTRTLFLNGRSRTTINGRTIAQESLRCLREAVIDLMSQFEQLGLLGNSIQLEYIDLFGGSMIAAAKKDYVQAFSAWREARSYLTDLVAAIDAAKAKSDLYGFQIMEFSSIGLDAIDENHLNETSRRLRHATDISNAALKAIENISGDSAVGALNSLREAKIALSAKPYLVDEFAKTIDLMDETESILEDALDSIRSRQEYLEDEPQQLDNIESTLYQLSLLKKKYADYIYDAGITPSGSEVTVGDLKSYRDHIKTAVLGIETADSSLAEAEARESQAAVTAISLAVVLSDHRRQAANSFETEVSKNLSRLNLTKTEIDIAVNTPSDPDTSDLRENGIDDISIAISLNPGEEPMPLSRIASGGELSRILLAVKTALNTIDFVPTVVFDEIDVGIGGKTAHHVGAMLASLGFKHQIICITHLAQIAAFADTHMMIRKSDLEGRTVTDIETLDENSRIQELARMLSGTPESSVSIKHAEELLNASQKSEVDR